MDIFEYFSEPTERLDLEASLYILKILPMIADSLTAHLQDELKKKGEYRFEIKHDLNQLAPLIRKLNIKNINSISKLGDENSHPENYAFSVADKLTSMIIDWYKGILGISYIGVEDREEVKDKLYEDSIMNKAQFLFSLKPNDIFIFCDVSNYIEFTFDKITKEEINGRTELICLYHKSSEGIVKSYREPNIYRAVVNRSVKLK